MRVAAAFDRAVDYDRHALVQRRVAEDLAATITDMPLPRAPRILEIGCGTGFLGASLIDRLVQGDWWMTDVAPNMVERARARFVGRSDVRFAVMDGADPQLAGPFDLICSSLAMQWFADLPAAIARLRALLSPAGALVFASLAEGSFAEWRAAHRGLRCGTPIYPAASELEALGLSVSVDTFQERHRDARDFLGSLKAIGAGTARADHRPLMPSELHQVMARFDANGAVCSYVVATCAIGSLTPFHEPFGPNL